MNELTDKLKKKLDKLAEKGNKYADCGKKEKAIKIWTEGLSLIPKPKNIYSETVWFLVSIGDMYFQMEQYSKAFECFNTAKSNLSGEGAHNPFVMLRIGECFFELGDEKNALEFLLRAYMTEGKEIFLSNDDGADDGSKYFDFLSSHIDLNNEQVNSDLSH